MTIPNQDTTLGITNLYLNPKANEEWDIVFNGEPKQLVTISGVEYITQKITQLLRMNKGEAIEFDEYGIPYFDEILGVKNPDLTAITQIFIDTIMDNETLQELGITDCEINDVTLIDRKLSILGLKMKFNNNSVEIEELSL